jgi:alpha-ketoglutarate-dependent taurine dioxygenase
MDGVRQQEIAPGQTLPLLIEPIHQDLTLVEFTANHRAPIMRALRIHGGILFRNFPGDSLHSFRQVMRNLSGEPLPYEERSSPRSEVEGNIYTSTDHPADSEIFLHNEQSYNLTWPRYIFFYCIKPAAARGGTTVADVRKIYRRVSPNCRRLEQAGYRYVRNFGTGFGLDWREVFQTDDKAEVEAYCERNEINLAWRPDGTLTTNQVRPVSAIHPETGELVWFNHLTFFNISTLKPEFAQALLTMGKDLLPNNTYYADGSDIEPEVLTSLREAYLAESTTVQWQPGDILMLDNMLAAHGRESFTPPREVVVGMTEPMSATGRPITR